MAKGQNIRAISELVMAGALWGFGFIASKWALGTFSTVELLLVRFGLAALVGLPIVLATRHAFDKKMKLSFMPAVLLMGTIAFQTWGLLYTTPTKAGFITTLYVIFVPIMEAGLGRKRLPAGIWLCVLVALIGTALIVDLGFEPLNFGDVLTFISALIATAQIYWMGSVSPRITRAFVFNLYQCFWCVAMAAPFIDYGSFGGKIANFAGWPTEVWVGICSLAFGSTLIAFYFQVRAQKELSRTVSSLLFLLESPFAMAFSILLLGERLTLLEACGALLIFVSAAAATFFEKKS